MKRWLILIVVITVVVALMIIAVASTRDGAREDLGPGPVPGSHLTEPTFEEQRQACPGVQAGQPIVRFSAPPPVAVMTICVPDPDTPGATAWDGPLVAEVISRDDSAEAAELLDRWADAWAGADDLPWLGGPVACTEEFRLNPSISITTTEGVTVRPVAPYDACKRPTEEADQAFSRLLHLAG